MKAVVYNTYGGPEVLKIQDVSIPRPKSNEVLIKVDSISLILMMQRLEEVDLDP